MAVAGDRLGQLLVLGGLDEFVHQLLGEAVVDAVAGLGPKANQQMRLAGAAVTDQARGVPGFDPGPGGQLVDLAGLTNELASKENSSMRLSGGAGVVDAPCCATLVPVVVLGHHQFGEETR